MEQSARCVCVHYYQEVPLSVAINSYRGIATGIIIVSAAADAALVACQSQLKASFAYMHCIYPAEKLAHHQIRKTDSTDAEF